MTKMKRNEEKARCLTNGVMDGMHIGVIVALITFCVMLVVRGIVLADLSAWAEQSGWNEFLTLVLIMVLGYAFWVIFDASYAWRYHIDTRLDSEYNFLSGLNRHRSDYDQRLRNEYQKAERKLRPELYSSRGRKTYRVMSFLMILLSVASALALSVSGLYVPKVILAVAVSGVAVFEYRCEQRLTYGYW